MTKSATPTRLDTDDPYMSVNDISKYLSVHRANVYRLMAEGRLPYVLVGPHKRRRVRMSDVAKLIED